MLLLLQSFNNDKVISRAFQKTWQSCAPGLNPSEFFPWGHLKNLVYRGRLVTFAFLKEGVTLLVKSISVDQLRSAVEQLSTEILYLQEGNHIEQHSVPGFREEYTKVYSAYLLDFSKKLRIPSAFQIKL